MQETSEQIGFSAGQIYNYLSENKGQSTFTKMKKELEKNNLFLSMKI